jgi:fatty-acyl-CoA synthase
MLLCGGAPVPEATIRGYTRRGLTFIQGYGMTETSPGALLLDAAHVESKAGSAGVPHFFTEVQVVRPDLTPAPAGETGEIVVAGPNVMQGYWNQPETTSRALAGGTWLRSGDAGTTDADGYVFVVDRIKDMIISGGENIYCAEVENVLASHPEIVEVAVIGRPHEKWGEVPIAVAAVTQSNLHLEDLDEFLGERLARYKHPKGLEIVDALPRNPAGKVLKTELRTRYGAPSGPQSAYASTDPPRDG